MFTIHNVIDKLDDSWDLFREEIMGYVSELEDLVNDTKAIEITPEKILDAILHGDETHREWLDEAIHNLWEGKEVPPPRGSNTSDALRAYITQLEDAILKLVDAEYCPYCDIDTYTHTEDCIVPFIKNRKV